jgi:hypothetical protein
MNDRFDRFGPFGIGTTRPVPAILPETAQMD